MHRASSASVGLITVLAALVAACGSSSSGAGGSATPSCNSGQSCAQTSHGQECIDSCSAGGVSTCPVGTVCTTTSGCCSGPACTAIAVHVCCPPAGC